VAVAALAVAALAVASCAGEGPQSPEQSPDSLLSTLTASGQVSEEFCLLVGLVCSKSENKGTAACKKLEAACASGGLVDAGVAIKDGRSPGHPDLVVTAIGWKPQSPQAGDLVTFSATIKNKGSGPTPAGTILGVSFSVQGAVVTWSDQEKNALAPGQSVTVTANGGPVGSGTWRAAQGTFAVEAWVDDVDRITGEVDETNNRLAVQLVVGGQPSGQCSAPPPPAAKAAGLTKLAFCDDFSDPTTFDFKGTGNPGFKWYRNYWFGFSQNTKPEDGEPESSFSISNGVLTLKTSKAHFQSNMQSAILKNNKPVGYYIDRQSGGWYVEARLAHPASADGVGVWSMDMCHIYAYPTACTRFVEPDWYELWTGGEARATHLWLVQGGKATKGQPDCNNWFKNGLDPAQFHNYAVLTTSAGVTYYRDDNKVAACDTMSWKGEVVAGAPGGGANVGRYPILIGTKPGHSMQVDVVRVWVKP